MLATPDAEETVAAAALAFGSAIAVSAQNRSCLEQDYQSQL